MPTALPFDVETAGLPPLVIRGRRLLPIVQGGMGVGVSAHRLAGTVARSAPWAPSPASTCAAITPTSWRGGARPPRRRSMRRT